METTYLYIESQEWLDINNITRHRQLFHIQQICTRENRKQTNIMQTKTTFWWGGFTDIYEKVVGRRERGRDIEEEKEI